VFPEPREISFRADFSGMRRTRVGHAMASAGAFPSTTWERGAKTFESGYSGS